jgi:hypothetical protein
MKRIAALSAALIALALTMTTADEAQLKFSWIDKVSDDPDKILPGVDPTKVTGPIVTSGSSTVFPLSEAVTELFVKEGYTGQVSIDSIGSGGGFERFGKGEIDIANASRGIKKSEIEKATASYGSAPLEIRVGTDALAVCVSKKNKFAKDLTMAELAKLFSRRSLLVGRSRLLPQEGDQALHPRYRFGNLRLLHESRPRQEEGAPPYLQEPADVRGRQRARSGHSRLRVRGRLLRLRLLRGE